MTRKAVLWALTAGVALVGAGEAPAQSSREAAVAIDRLDVSPASDVQLEVVSRGLRLPWSVAFLPSGEMLVREKHRGLKLVRPSGASIALDPPGPVPVLAKSDSGYLDVVLDPDFTANRLIYLAFAEGTEDANRTAIWKARLQGTRLTGGRVIFRTNFAKKGTAHPGGRLLFLPDRSLLLSVGDGFNYRDAAQDMGSHLGKVLRLTRDGTAPADNPFVGRAGVAPEIWTSGHRNIQGLTLDPATGAVWAHEHGPRGGDELNLLKPGLNYGWPLVSHGIDYDGSTITERAFGQGFTPSRFYWAPSIAPSGLAIYRGDRYRDWVGKFFVGGLVSRSLVRLRTGRDSGLIVEEERMLANLKTRIRDVREGPDGHLYLLTDEEDGKMLRLIRPDTAR